MTYCSFGSFFFCASMASRAGTANVVAGNRASSREYSWMESAGSPASPALWADSNSSFCSAISPESEGGGWAGAGLGVAGGTAAPRLDTNAATRASSANLRSSALRRMYQTSPTSTAAKTATTSQNRIVTRKV